MNTYDRALAQIKQAIDDEGFSVTLSGKSGPLDPESGRRLFSGANAEIQILLKNVSTTTSNQSSAKAGDQVSLGDKQIITLSEIQNGSKFTFGGSAWSVYGVSKTFISGKVLYYTGFVRENG